MKRTKQKILAVVLAAALILSLMPAVAPMTAYAASTDDLAATINNFNHGGSGALSASATWNIVTVTGNVTGATAGNLALDIGEGVTVAWQATLKSETKDLLTLSGGGTFLMESGEISVTLGVPIKASGDVAVRIQGGAVKSDSNSAIDCSGAGNVVTVSGGTVTGGANTATFGTVNMRHTAPTVIGPNVVVSGTGKVIVGNVGAGIITYGDVLVSGGEVSATRDIDSGHAIWACGAASSVTVSGGEVKTSSTGAHDAIYVEGANSSVTVSGGTVSGGTAGASRAIRALGTNSVVTVSGTGIVQFTASVSNSIAIGMTGANSKVVVDGGEVKGNVGDGINAAGSVEVKSGTVSGGTAAISSYGAGSSVTVSGGTVSSSSGNAIDAAGGPIDVQGGEVRTVSGRAIYLRSDAAALTVSGGTVIATGTTGYAVVITRNVAVTVSGGTVEATATGSGNASMAILTSSGESAAGSLIIVSGTGKVSAKGDNTENMAIDTYGSVRVEGGEVSAAYTSAIQAEGAASVVTVSGGTVTGPGKQNYILPVIDMTNNAPTVSGPNVVISGTGKVTATAGGGVAISTFGSADVRGGEIIAQDGAALQAGGTESVVTVSGGTVTSAGTSSANPAIYLSSAAPTVTGANVIVKGGKVEASANGGVAVRTSGGADIQGGEVSAQVGPAILADGAASAVSVSGGTVRNTATSSANPVIDLTGSSAVAGTVNVTVNGTGQVVAEGSGGYGIRTYGSVQIDGGKVSAEAGTSYGVTTRANSSTITVNGGEVSATAGRAVYPGALNNTVIVNGGKITATAGKGIYNYYNTGTVTVNGGLVFAYADAIPADYLVYTGGTYNAPSANGAVIVWNQAANTTVYTAGTSTDIVTDPAGATAYWAKSGGESGIYYKNGTAEGFIPLSVTVNGAGAALAFIDSPAFDIPASEVGTAIAPIDVSAGAVGGTPPYSFSATGLPDGMSIAPSTGVISGAPIAEGSAGTATITVTDNVPANAQITIAYGAISPMSDATAPVLTAGSVNRTSDTAATIGFTTDEAGTAYYLALDSGATAPAKANVKDANNSLGSVAAGAVSDKSATLTAGAKDIYVVVEDAAGNISEPLKITATAYIPPDVVINLAAISGITAPAAGATPVTSITETAQYTGTVSWNGGPATFDYGTVYTATVTLTPKTGYTLTGVASDFFTVSGATTVNNAANSGVVTAVFPATAAKVNAVTPTIGTDLSTGEVTYSAGGTATALTVAATASDGGTLSYQWYSNDTNDTDTPTAVGANADSHTPDISATGTLYYYVVITNTINDNGDGGDKTAAATSAIAKITTNAAPPDTYAVTFSVTGGNGSLSATVDSAGITSGNTIQAGKTAVFEATPNNGYRVKEWKDNDSTVNGTNATYTVSGLAAAHTVTVEFEAVPPTVTSVTVSPAAIEVMQGGTQQFAATVTGTNNPAQTVNWSVTGGNSASTDISNSGLLTVGADETAAALTVTATSTVDGSKFGSAAVTVTSAPPAPIYGIALDTGGTHIFPNATEGYEAQNALSVTVTNTGNQATGDLAVALSGTNTGAFELSATSITGIAKDGNAGFTVNPKTGLAANTYTATVTVSGANGITAGFDVSFTVNQASSGTGSTGGSSGSGTITPTTPPTATPAPGSSTVTTPTDKPPVQNPDGSQALPGGGTVTVGGQESGTSANAPTVTITAPAGTVIEADGGVTIPANESATMTITPQGAANGSGAAMTVAVPGGTSIDKEGNITVPAGKEAEISLPESKAEVTAPGGTTITAGGTVTVGNGTANIALPGGTAVSVPTGSTIHPDGTVSIGAGGATVQIAIRTSAAGNNSDAAVQNSDGSVGIGDVSVPLAAAPGTSPSLTLKLAANTVIVLDEAAPLGYSVEFNNPYSDVKSSDWFYGDVAFVGAHGLMTGTAADKFSPNAQATRGMIVTVLFRCAEEQLRMESGELRIGDASHTDEKPAERFEDVLLGKYYSDAVAWAAENEIVGGVGGGRFAPDANITRQDLAVILTRYAEYKGLPLAALREYAAFSDDNAVSDYARAAVEACYRAGIISGKPNNLFDPKGEATRAEVAAMLHRFILAMAGDVEPDEEEA